MRGERTALAPRVGLALNPRTMKFKEGLEGLQARLERRAAQAVMALPDAVLRKLVDARRQEPVDGHTLDFELAVLLRLDDLMKTGDPSRFTPAVARRHLRRGARVAVLPPRPDVVTRELRLPGPACELRARLYVPKGLAEPSPLVVYIHGGGFVTCDLDTHDSVCRELAFHARARVVSVEYRLAPEHPFPAAVEDALAAYRWVAAHARELGGTPTRLALMGDSAGGNLSAIIARHTRDDALPPALQVLVYPATAGSIRQPSWARYASSYLLTQEAIDWYYGHYVPNGVNPRDPDLAPLFAANLGGTARALVYTAGFDPLLDEGRAYAERLREAGVSVHYRCFEPLTHGFLMMDGLCEAARRASQEIYEDVGRALSVPAAGEVA